MESASPSDTSLGLRVIPFLIVIAICLVAGLLLGIFTGGGFNLTQQTPEPPATFVLLGYDNLQDPTRLEFLWILTLDGKGNAHYQGISAVTVFTSTSGQAILLRDLLADPSAAPARLYQIPFLPQPSTAVEFDRVGLATIINRMGGLRMGGTTYRGQEAIALVTALFDPLESLRKQSELVEALFGNAGPCPDAATLAGLHPEHILSPYPPDVLVSECIKRGPYLEGTVVVEIMDNALPIILPGGNIGLLPNT